MATSDHIQTALLTEHFRYTPLTLLDEIINTVNELVYRAVTAVETGLSSASPSSLGFSLPPNTTHPTSQQARQDALTDLAQTELSAGIIQLESLLNATVDKDFDKFEIYCLRNILCLGHGEEDLAPWVRLEHYKHVDFEAVERAPKPEEVQLQRRKLHETMKLNAMLKAEEARNEVVLERLRGLMVGGDGGRGEGFGSSTQKREAPLAFLMRSAQVVSSSSGASSKGLPTPAQQPLTQTVTYALSQLPALRNHLSELRTALNTLPNARHRKLDEDSAEATRARYLDSQARRALERRGMDVEAAARTAAAGIGRKVGEDEIEGIRAVVKALEDEKEAGKKQAEAGGERMEA